MTLPSRVTLVEVGPRDGLQHERQALPVQTRIEFINRLSAAGLPCIEAGSFVSPKWVPQMADTDQVLAGIQRRAGTSYSVLVPNMRGMETLMRCEVDEIAVFAACSETFSQKNINCSIDESLRRFEPVCQAAERRGIRVRGYVSCVLGCPYEGYVDPMTVSDVTDALLQMGCYEISLGDTIGTGTPGRVQDLLEVLTMHLPVANLALHFHDTYGQALTNIYAAMEYGVATIDSSVSGLGGCPYAKGASGNVATEDVLYMLNGLEIETGVDMDKLLEAGSYINSQLGRQSVSKAGMALARAAALG